MRLYYEWGVTQRNKRGEELCGDSIGVSRGKNWVTVALSDGLGSGVKANILATLTTRIAMHMLENSLPLEEVVQTLGETLPECNVRKMAYSTFAIAQFFARGYVRIVEFDSPFPMLVRERRIQRIGYRERCINGKTVYESMVDLEEGDWMMFVSDGVINAGIGGRYPLGWGWENAAAFLEKTVHPRRTAQYVAERIADTVDDLYEHAPGDDVSVIVIKVRRKQVATVLTGPPADKARDGELVRRFMKVPGKRVVCGGTTAKIVAHHLGIPLEVDLKTMRPDVPPLGRIEGVDLVTEGILTLTKVRELLRSDVGEDDIAFRTDGASELLRLFFGVDHVHFLVGQAVNPAHQNPELPQQLELRLAVVREIAEELRKRHIEVTVESI